MKSAGHAGEVSDRSLPLVVVAGEFCTGKSSLINLLLRQRVLQPSVGLQTQMLTRLRHGSTMILNACRRDGAVQQVQGIEQAAAMPDVAKVELQVPFNNFPGVEIQELPAPSDGTFADVCGQAAASAEIMLWCTIGSQPWRLSEKDCISKLGRRPDQTTILCVMRDDLIRSDSDRGKINRRLQTEARPFFSDIIFIDASTKSFQSSLTDVDAWHNCGAGAIGSAISRLPNANIEPPPYLFSTDPPGDLPEPMAQKETVQNVVSMPNLQEVADPNQRTSPKTIKPDEKLDLLMSEALEVLLGAVSKINGCRYAAIVIDATYVRESGDAVNLTTIAAARALFFAQMRDAENAGPVEEVVIQASRETHLLSAIDKASLVHLVFDPSVTTLASVRLALRKLTETTTAVG